MIYQLIDQVNALNLPIWLLIPLGFGMVYIAFMAAMFVLILFAGLVDGIARGR